MQASLNSERYYKEIAVHPLIADLLVRRNRKLLGRALSFLEELAPLVRSCFLKGGSLLASHDERAIPTTGKGLSFEESRGIHANADRDRGLDPTIFGIHGRPINRPRSNSGLKLLTLWFPLSAITWIQLLLRHPDHQHLALRHQAGTNRNRSGRAD